MIKNRRAFITGLKSITLNHEEKKFLKKYKPWGVIIFSRNIKTFNQLQKLTNNIKKIFNDNNYPILIDEEGGRVNRLKNLFDTSIFTGEFFGKIYKKDLKKFNLYFSIYVKQLSYILRKVGININTVPVLDIRRKDTDKVIGNRSFGNNPKFVSKIGDFYIKEFHKNHIGSVIKHIPGHGLAKVDSHKKTPVVNLGLKQLIKNDFYPFKKKSSFFAMTAHIVYNKVDKLNTATHSKTVINLVRKKIKFKNLIVSDDISMKSLKYSTAENTKKAFSAGCNLVLHCNGKINEMRIVAKNSPKVNKFIITKTSQFYKMLK